MASGHENEIVDVTSPLNFRVRQPTVDGGKHEFGQDARALPADGQAERSACRELAQEAVNLGRHLGAVRKQIVDAIFYAVMIDMLVKAGDVGLNDDDPITLRLTIGNTCLSEGTPRRRPIKQSIALLGIPIGMGAVTAERLVRLGDGDPKAIQIDVPERVNLGRDPEAGGAGRN